MIEEVAEYHATWAAESKHPVSAEQFWSCWQEQYLRLLRTVGDEHLSADLLCDGERTRLESLEAVDVDDPPSVILSLSLGVFFLSEDPRAVRAVYGEGVDLEEHRSWLAVLGGEPDDDEAAMVTEILRESGSFKEPRIGEWQLPAMFWSEMVEGS